MKKSLLILIVIAVGAVAVMYLSGDTGMKETSVTTTEDMENLSEEAGSVEIVPIAHASAVLNWDGVVIYADPVGGSEAYAGQPDPDIAFVSHEHGDHLNVETLQGVLKEKTILLVPQAVADKLPDDILGTVVVLGNGDTHEIGVFMIEAVPSYNIREEALDRHPRGRDNGYVIEHIGTRVYFSGDSEDTTEMRALRDIDIAFVAMNLPFTMGVESAADAVLEFKPKQVYPYHFRTPEGFSDVAKFKEIVNAGDPDIEVVQLDWYPN